MKQLRKPIYVTAGYNTISLGSGRKEFSPKAARPGLEHYISEAGNGAIAQINEPANIDEGVITNFMAERYCRQGNRPGFFPMIHPSFQYKPATGVEGACGSGGLGLVVACKTILADVADAVLVIGVEVQNTVKAVYGADYLAGAGWYAGERKQGHAHFFPAQFSDRAGAYFDKFGKDKTREAMARWYEQAILNARKNPKAQEYHNTIDDLFAVGMTPPNPSVFCEHINVYDCSKVSDAASAIIFASEEGLKKLGVSKKDAAEVVAWGQCEDDITKKPPDLTKLTTTQKAVELAYERAGISSKDISVLEVHDCFTISGVLSMEATGLARYGEGADFVREGRTRTEIPTNTTGGLIGYGHPVGASGVRQAVDIMHQLIGKAGDCQVEIDSNRPYGMMISMGGNDKTVVVMIFKKIE
ncbi:MAG: 3-ketoacyl-CoA thiolase [bacterium]|nr:3-ketoacyl-CoA thiolase [bacterium]